MKTLFLSLILVLSLTNVFADEASVGETQKPDCQLTNQESNRAKKVVDQETITKPKEEVKTKSM